MAVTEPMSERINNRFADHIKDLRQQDLFRYRRVLEGAQSARVRLEGREYLSFCSNDYLGLANHPRIAAAAKAAIDKYGVGAGASGMVTGHMQVHETLEADLARFVGLPRAMHFASGYQANIGVICSLAGRGDTIYSDALNHASLIDGTRLSRAEVRRYAHADMAALEQSLSEAASGLRLVVTDSVFSMDGDIAPLPRLLALCEQYDALLMVDDAHGFGVLGEHGRGCLEHFGLASERIIYVGTLGKAAGVAGAFVAGSDALVENILQRARTYMFSTATPPMLAAALLESLRVLSEEAWRREHLRALIGQLKSGVAAYARLLPSQTAIQPMVLGANAAALEFSARLKARGILVPAIRPPTVPEGTARLRISLSAAHSMDEVNALIEALRVNAPRAAAEQAPVVLDKKG